LVADRKLPVRSKRTRRTGRRRPRVKTQATQTDRDDHVFKALANADRRAILDYLRKAPRSTKAICQLLQKLDRCTVMLHLRILESAELIMSQRQGRVRTNYLNVAPIQGIYRRWIREYAQPAAELLTALKRQLEG
jgi:DNA-binding transcriptional ArsR family regulator